MIARPLALPVNFGGIPADIRAHPHWVLWGYVYAEDHWKKVPFQTNGKYASTTDSSTWASFEEVWDVMILEPRYEGIGLILSEGLDGIDLDDCRDQQTGELADLANDALLKVEGYAEVSPSGTGIKLFSITNMSISGAKKGIKTNFGQKEAEIDIELYKADSGRFFTVTGHALNGHNALPPTQQDVDWLTELVGEKSGALFEGTDVEKALALYKPALEGWDSQRIRDEVGPYLDLSMHYNDWLKVGQALHHQFDGAEAGLDLWNELFCSSPKYKGPRYEEKKWATFSATRAKGNGPITLGWVIKLTKAARDSAEMIAKRQAVDNARGQIDACIDDMALRTTVAESIAKDKYLDKNQREILVAIWNVKHKDLTGTKLPAKTVRELLGVNSKVLQHSDHLEAPSWAKPWVFVTDVDKFLNLETKQEVTTKGFKGLYNRYMPIDRFTGRQQADIYALEHWKIPVVAHRSYMPSVGSVFQMFGKYWANLYRVDSVPEMPAILSADELQAIDLVRGHFERYLNDERERGIFLSWIAHNVQNPGVKIRWSPYMHGPPGDGKSFFGELLGHAMGGQNVRSLNGSTLESNFTDWAMGYAVTSIEEMKQHGHNRYDVMNKLKPFITNTEVEIHPKGRPSYVAPNNTNYLVLSNYLDGAPVEDEDRRYMFISSSLRLADVKLLTDAGYYKNLFLAIQAHPGAIRHWLLGVPLHPEFQANGRAPHTSTKDTVVEMSKSELDILTEELIEQGAVGVHKQVISSAHLSRALRARTDEPFQTSRVNRMLTIKGFRFKERKWWNGQACRIWTVQGEPMNINQAMELLDSTTGSDFLEAKND